MTFSPEQLNFFKFSTVVLDEFPVALRKVFVFMWDTYVASPPGVPKWDDSVTVLNLLHAKEGGVKKVPTLNKSYKEWDCTALSRATLFAQTFAVPDGTGGFSTLDKLYVRPRGLSAGTFHPFVISPTGNKAETCALVLDQLRLLRNALCHQISTQKIDKATFDHYILLAKDAFAALGQNTSKTDEIGKLVEEDFPAAKQQQLETELKKEKDAAIKFKHIDDHLKKIESQVEDVGSGVKDVKNEVTDVKTQVEDVGSDLKDVKTVATDVKTQVEDVRSDVKDVKTEVTDVKTQVEDVRSDVKDVKTEVTDVKTQVKDVGSNVKDVKTEVTDVKTQVEDVESDVKDVKTDVIDVKTQVKDVGSDVKEVKTEVTNVKTQVKDVGSDVKDVKTEVTDVKGKVEDVVSGVMELEANIISGIEQAMKAESLKSLRVPKSCIPDNIPHFVGRQKVCQAILNHLTNGDTRVVDVWGPPGFGKTSVAINVAQQLKDIEIPVYFASLRGMKRKDDLVSKLLGIFADAKQAFYNSPSQWLIQNLQRLENPFVLILDNADDLLETGDFELKEEVLSILEEILDQCNYIKLLITTRESLDYWSHKRSIHLERVGVLDEISSDDLVMFLLPDVSEIDRNSLVQVCGQVPLAMRLMCTVVTEENTSVSKLLEFLKTSPLFEVLDDGSFPKDSQLRIIIDTCFAKLAKQDRDAFVSLGVFPGSFGIEEAKKVLNLNTDQQTKKRLRSLKRKSLIECGDDFESCIIHSLFRSFVEEKSTTDQETGAVFNKAKQFYSLCNFETANEKFLTGYSNEALAAFLDNRESIISSLINGAKDDELHVRVVKVLSEAELLLFSALNDEELLFTSIYDAVAEEAAKKGNEIGTQKLLAAKSFGHWGWFSSDRQVWDISLETDFLNAAYCPAKLQCYYGVYQILCDRLEEGMSSLKSSVDLLTSNCDEKVLKLLVYSVLGGCYLRKQEYEMTSHYVNLCSGELATTTASLTSQEDVYLAGLTEIQKDSSFLTLRSYLFSLANREEVDQAARRRMFTSGIDLALMMGRFHDGNGQIDPINWSKESSQLLKQFGPGNHWIATMLNRFLKALDIHPADSSFEQRLPEHLDTIPRPIASYTVVKSMIEFDLKEYQRHTNGRQHDVDSVDAKFLIFFNPIAFSHRRSIYENALKSYQEVSGADFEDLARSYDKLGTLSFSMKDYSRAEELFRQALRLREENNSLEKASTLTNLGHVCLKMNNVAKAEKVFKDALELRKQLGVYDHVDTANIHHTIGENYFFRGNFTEALEASQNALELKTKHLGEHALTALSLNLSGNVYLKMGNYESAKEAFHKSREMISKMGDERNTAVCCLNLAAAYYQSGSREDLVSARAFCKDGLAIWGKLDDFGEIINSVIMLGHIQIKMGEFSEVIDIIQKMSSAAKEIYGDQVITAIVCHLAGLMCRELGLTSSAVEAFQDASRIMSILLGDHEDTAQSYYRLGEAQYDFGDLDEALGSLQTASRMRKQVLGDHPDTAKSLHLRNRVYEDLSAKVLDCD